MCIVTNDQYWRHASETNKQQADGIEYFALYDVLSSTVYSADDLNNINIIHSSHHNIANLND